MEKIKLNEKDSKGWTKDKIKIIAMYELGCNPNIKFPTLKDKENEMDVRKNTLHFKLWKFSVFFRDFIDPDYKFKEEPPNNICPYFWHIITWALFIPLLLIFAVAFISVTVLYLPPKFWLSENCTMVDYFFYGLIPYWFSVLVIFISSYFLSKSDKACNYLGESTVVGYEYIKAKSNNLCIKLNWIDDKVEDEDKELPDKELPKEKTLGEKIENAIDANIERMSEKEGE